MYMLSVCIVHNYQRIQKISSIGLNICGVSYETSLVDFNVIIYCTINLR